MSSTRKRVVWDESNLRANAEYQKAHPVTMHITEPKTPYIYMDDDVDESAAAGGGGGGGGSSSTTSSSSTMVAAGGTATVLASTFAAEDACTDGGGGSNSSDTKQLDGDVADGGTTWDPVTNAFVRRLKEHILDDRSDAPRAPVSSSGRPMLAPGTTSGELAQQRHANEFAKMRKAVYADEGAKFRALLARQRQKQQQQQGDDDEDDDEDDDDDGDKEEQ